MAGTAVVVNFDVSGRVGPDHAVADSEVERRTEDGAGFVNLGGEMSDDFVAPDQVEPVESGDAGLVQGVFEVGGCVCSAGQVIQHAC